MKRLLLAATLIAAPAFGQGTVVQDVSQLPTRADVEAAAAAAAAAQSAAAAAQMQAQAARAALASYAPLTTLSGYVRSVQSVSPDSSGNVNGIATQAMVQSATFDTLQVATNPASGAAVQANQGIAVLFVNNAALLVALTIGLPPSPADGQRFTVCTNAAVTTMGFTGGTIKGALGSFSANGYARFIYSVTIGAWFRAG